MARRLIRATVGAALFAACRATTPADTTLPTAPHGVASVRLFDSQNAELTFHIPLLAGVTTRFEVRLYAPDGTPVTTVPGGVELAGFSFTPTSFASITAVPGLPLDRNALGG